jgi:trimethylamine:corrinoid methyltransferase-like protein
MRPKLEILDHEDVQKIIEAAYDLLETFGVKIYNQEALEILAERGAKVDIYVTGTVVPGDKAKEIKSIMQSYAKSKGVEKLPQVPEGWKG